MKVCGRNKFVLNLRIKNIFNFIINCDNAINLILIKGFY